MIAEFVFTDVKVGGRELFVDHDISSQPLNLPPGAFGYSYEIKDNATGPIFATGDNGSNEVRSVSQNLNFNVPGAPFPNQLFMLLTGTPLPPSPPAIHLDVEGPPLVLFDQQAKFEIRIDSAGVPPVVPFFNTEFFLA